MIPTLRLLPAILLFPVAAHGSVITTAKDEDNGSLGGGTGISLREAVKYSVAGDTITFAAALSGQTLRLTLGQIIIDRALTIDGSALPARLTLTGDKTGDGTSPDDSRVFRVDDVVLALDSLIFSDSTNSSDTYGGGAIYASGHAAKLTVDRSTFSGNQGTTNGGAIHFYGAYQSPETVLIVRNSTFSGNTATGFGGAIFAFGILDVQNSTFTANSANKGGGIAINQNTPSTIDHTTITGNAAATSHGGVYNSGSLSLQSTILVGNTAPASPDISGTYTGTNNLTSGNPLLAPLGDYGGPTWTMPPLNGSPAIETGGVSALTTDQRGFPRQPKTDIGAVEYQFATDPARFWKLDFDGDGVSYGAEQALGTDPAVADIANPRHLAAPTFNAAGHAVLSFGLNSAAAQSTRWILHRSPDLSPGSFTEIFRTNRATDTAAPGVTFVRTATRVTVTDENPLPGGGFYRFEARLGP